MNYIDVLLWLLGIISIILVLFILFSNIFTSNDRKIFFISSAMLLFLLYIMNGIYKYGLSIYQIIKITLFYSSWFLLYKSITNILSRDKDGVILYLV
jgi:hypothetical protein